MMGLELLYVIPVMALAACGYITIRRGSDTYPVQCMGIACILVAGNIISRMWL
jgi:hypothetical protein